MSLLPALILAEKKFRLIKFGNGKEIEKRISPCERTLSPWFFDLSFGRNFRHFTFPIPPRKGEKREKNGYQFLAYLGRIYGQMSVFPAVISARKKIRLSNFGYEKHTENQISPCERTLWASFFSLSLGRNFRDFTVPIPPRKARKR